MNSTQTVTAELKDEILRVSKSYSHRVFKIVKRVFEEDNNPHLALRELQRRLNNYFDSKYSKAAFEYAIVKNSLTLLKLVVLIGTEMSTSRTSDFETPLTLSISESNKSIVEFLLEKGVDTDILDSNGCSPLQLALLNGEVEIVKLILSKKYTDINFQDDTDIVTFLLDKDDVVIVSNTNSSTLLYFAANISDEALRMVLFKSSTTNRSSVFLRDEYFICLLIQMKNKTMIHKLIDYGLNLNLLTHYYTPLILALHNAEEDMILFLLKKGANVNFPNGLGMSPIHYIECYKDNINIFKLLIEYGANINSLNSKRRNVLHLACQQNVAELVNVFLEFKVDVNALDFKNQTPLELALNISQDKMNNLFRNLVAAIANMITNKEYVSQRNIECINEDVHLRCFYEKCKNEISRLKEEKISKESQIRYCDFLTSNLQKLTTLARNETVMSILKKKSYMEVFPIYSLRLKRNIERAIWRLKRTENNIKLFQERTTLPEMFIDQVCGYLTDIELRNSELYFKLILEQISDKK